VIWFVASPEISLFLSPLVIHLLTVRADSAYSPDASVATIRRVSSTSEMKPARVPFGSSPRPRSAKAPHVVVRERAFVLRIPNQHAVPRYGRGKVEVHGDHRSGHRAGKRTLDELALVGIRLLVAQLQRQELV